MNTAVIEAPRAAPIKATWVCLVLAWVLFLVPVPGAGLFVGWPLNLVAFILAIVVMARGRTAGGLIPLICSIVVSPIVYFVGLAIFGATVAGVGQAAEEASRARAADTSVVAAAAPAQPAIELSAQALFAAYDANEVSADDQYKGQRLAVTGTVAGINKDFTDSVYVQIDSGQMFQTVDARGIAPDVASALSKGETVTVECTGNGLMIGSPQLRDCSLR